MPLMSVLPFVYALDFVSVMNISFNPNISIFFKGLHT